MSARDGAGSPDGWLWQKMTAAAPAADQGTKDVAGVDLDAREAAAGKELVEDHAVADVKCDGPELLDGQVGESGAHVGPDLCGSGETLAANRALSNGRPGKGEGVTEAPGFGGLDAGGNQLGLARGAEGLQPAEPGQEALGGGDFHVEDTGEELGTVAVSRFRGGGSWGGGSGWFERFDELAIFHGFLLDGRDAHGGAGRAPLRRRTALSGGPVARGEPTKQRSVARPRVAQGRRRKRPPARPPRRKWVRRAHLPEGPENGRRRPALSAGRPPGSSPRNPEVAAESSARRQGSAIGSRTRETTSSSRARRYYFLPVPMLERLMVLGEAADVCFVLALVVHAVATAVRVLTRVRPRPSSWRGATRSASSSEVRT